MQKAAAEAQAESMYSFVAWVLSKARFDADSDLHKRLVVPLGCQSATDLFNIF